MANKNQYDYKIHPLAALFPELSPDEFKKLKNDIQEHGQREPIMLSEDGTVLLDGRNRMRACKELGIQPRIECFEDGSRRSAMLQRIFGEPKTGISTEAEYIWSINVLRRHLTDDQKAMLASKWSDTEKQAAKERQREHGATAPGRSRNTSGESAQSVRTRKVLANKAKVSEYKIRQAETVTKHAPAEIVEKVKSGTMKLKDAAKQIEQKPNPAPQGPAPRANHHYLDPSHAAGRLLDKVRTKLKYSVLPNIDPNDDHKFHILFADMLESFAAELRARTQTPIEVKPSADQGNSTPHSFPSVPEERRPS